MGKFSKKTKANPNISTASLPDIVFMLLFFFMVTTVLRETDILVEQRIPQGTQIQKLEKKSLVTYLYVGKPRKTAIFGSEPKVQANDVFIDLDEIILFVEGAKAKLGEEGDQLTVSLKVDKETKMGIVSDVKQELRNANARKLNYTVSRRVVQ